MDNKQRQFFEQIIQGFMAREKQNKLENYRRLNRLAIKGETVFCGSSLMEQFPVLELKMSLHIPGIIYNRGIGGYTTSELLKVLDTCIFDLEPSRLFINIGSNDMSELGFTVDHLATNYRAILDQVRERLPDCQINLMAYYPINDTVDMPGMPMSPAEFFATRNNTTIAACNHMVASLATEYSARYIDVNHVLCDDSGRLKAEYTVEGLHMWSDAYRAILGELLSYLEE